MLIRYQLENKLIKTISLMIVFTLSSADGLTMRNIYWESLGGPKQEYGKVETGRQRRMLQLRKAGRERQRLRTRYTSVVVVTGGHCHEIKEQKTCASQCVVRKGVVVQDGTKMRIGRERQRGRSALEEVAWRTGEGRALELCLAVAGMQLIVYCR